MSLGCLKAVQQEAAKAGCPGGGVFWGLAGACWCCEGLPGSGGSQREAAAEAAAAGKTAAAAGAASELAARQCWQAGKCAGRFRTAISQPQQRSMAAGEALSSCTAATANSKYIKRCALQQHGSSSRD